MKFIIIDNYFWMPAFNRKEFDSENDAILFLKNTSEYKTNKDRYSVSKA